MSVILLLFDGFPPVAEAEPDQIIEEWSLKRRRGLRKYICAFCDRQYWEDQVIVQGGRIRCTGPNTLNCVDRPGFRPAFRDLQLPIEQPNPPLPVDDEEL